MADAPPAQQYVVFDARKLMGPLLVEHPLDALLIGQKLWPLLPGLSPTDYTLGVPLVEFYTADSSVIKPPFTPQEVFSVTSTTASTAQKFRDAVPCVD